ncbi:MAG: substrate-binding domain-containing protein [Oscillospiraceae bacterium]|nr:substrate-binding domain-containing protein [Oscillospiraceae bacterium]
MKRIGVIIPAITDNLQSELLDGIYRTAAAAGCDVIVVTTATSALEFHIQSEIMEGEESIYALLERARLDGVLLVSQYFIKETVRQKLSEIIRKTRIPCIDLGGTALGFDTVTIPQDEAVYELTSHIIEQHGCRDLLFLAGYAENPDSEQRMQGFLRAAKAHECTYEIHYGDFWKTKAAELGTEFVQQKRPLPDAVICASDIMAVTLCDTLHNGGISVPDDVIVTGFDGHLVALSHFPSITTVSGGMQELGRKGTEKLFTLIGCRPAGSPDTGMHILYSASCGCVKRLQGYEEAALRVQDYIRHEAEATEMLDMRIHSDYITKASDVETLGELTSVIDQIAHTLKGYQSMFWCLYPDWDAAPEQPDMIRKKSFPKQMLCVLAKDAWQDGRNGGLFPTAEIVPMLSQPHEPVLLFVLSLHASSQVFGYCGLAYANAADFSVSVMLFNMMSAVANGLRMLRHKRYAEYLQRKIEEASLYDKMTDMLSKKGLLLYLEKQEVQSSRTGIMLVTIDKLTPAVNVRSSSTFSDKVMQTELLLANAIRLLSGKHLQTARLDKRTFAVVFPLSGKETPERRAEEIMIQLEVLIRKMQEGTAEAFLPEPYYICGICRSPAEQCLSELMDRLSTQPKGTGFTGIHELKKIRRELHKAPELSWNLGEIARRLNISKNYVQKLYKEHFGISYIEDLIEARIHMAQELLTTTDLRITEIAEACGYRNDTHFMRQFKDKTGVTPTEYRNRHS